MVVATTHHGLMKAYAQSTDGVRYASFGLVWREYGARLCGGDAVKLGNPLVSGAKVSATVIAHGRGTKVKIFKLRRRKHYTKTQGHRQNYTEIRVDSIA